MENLREIIAEWLRGPELPEMSLREQPNLEETNGLRRILAVVGPRRAGKTYFLYQLISEAIHSGKTRRDEVLFVDFEDYRLRDFSADDIQNLLAAFYQETGKPPRYLFFDEIQRMPYWSRVLRTLHNSRRYEIVVSGSNASLLSSEIATELRGRYEDRLILPFSFSSSAKAGTDPPSFSTSSRCVRRSVPSLVSHHSPGSETYPR